jgi:hypothetical protein
MRSSWYVHAPDGQWIIYHNASRFDFISCVSVHIISCKRAYTVRSLLSTLKFFVLLINREVLNVFVFGVFSVYVFDFFTVSCNVSCFFCVLRWCFRLFDKYDAGYVLEKFGDYS